MNKDYSIQKLIGFDQIEEEFGISRRRVRRMMNSGLISPSVAYHPLGGKRGGGNITDIFSPNLTC